MVAKVGVRFQKKLWNCSGMAESKNGTAKCSVIYLKNKIDILSLISSGKTAFTLDNYNYFEISYCFLIVHCF